MSEIFIPNNRVACEPFEKRSIEVQVKSGFATAKSKNELVRLKVLFRGGGVHGTMFWPGGYVYVRGDVSVPWSKEAYTLDGQKVIFVPADQVFAYELPQVPDMPILGATNSTSNQAWKAEGGPMSGPKGG